MPELVHGRCGDPAAYDADRFGGLAAGILWRELADKTPGGREVIELPQRFLQLRQRIDVVRRSGSRIQRREEFDRVAQRHRARIAAKKLRYAVEFFAPLYSRPRASDYIDALAKLQEALGKLNDLATAGRLVSELAPKDASRETAEAVGIVRGWIAASTMNELGHAAKARRALGRLKPFWN